MYTKVSGTEGGRIQLRGRDLATEVMGSLGFTDAIYLAIRGELPERPSCVVLDAVLVALIDHGVTSSTLATRMAYRAAPDALQAALAAGILNSGGRALGSMEGCGRLLAHWAPRVAGSGVASTAAALFRTEREAGRRLPGFGHHKHGSGDPRAGRLLEIADEQGRAGIHVQLIRSIEAEAADVAGRPLFINVTGAIAAVLLDLGFRWELLRGFGILSRVPGLIAHLGEEIESNTADRLIRYLQQDGVWDKVME